MPSAPIGANIDGLLAIVVAGQEIPKNMCDFSTPATGNMS
jgi:hypothetical protein